MIKFYIIIYSSLIFNDKVLHYYLFVLLRTKNLELLIFIKYLN